MYRGDLFHIESKVIYQNEERPLEAISWPLSWYGIQPAESYWLWLGKE